MNETIKNILQVSVVVAGVGMSVATYHYIDNKHATSAYYQGIYDSAYQICNASRQDATIYSEEACGAFLEANNLDFICDANNTLPTTKCHVEDLLK